MGTGSISCQSLRQSVEGIEMAIRCAPTRAAASGPILVILLSCVLVSAVAGCSGEECTGGLTDCDGRCVDTHSDRANCGECEQACGSTQYCETGSCVECGAPRKLCQGSCVGVTSDADNCGECGNRCDTAAGLTCMAGSCVCAPGLLRCKGQCVNTLTDKGNCGGCGQACASDTVCVAGTCKPATECKAPETICDQACVDLTKDGDNCSACGKRCDAAKGFACASGSCGCFAGATECQGICVNNSTNPHHCGACGQSCQANEACVAGACKPTDACPPPKQVCAGACVDLNESDDHCGACNIHCSPPLTVCYQGECVPGLG